MSFGGEKRGRFLCVFGRVVWIEILDLDLPSLSIIAQYWPHRWVHRRPPSPPMFGVSPTAPSSSARGMHASGIFLARDGHAPLSRLPLRRRTAVLGGSSVFLLAAPPSPHRVSVWVVFFSVLFVVFLVAVCPATFVCGGVFVGCCIF